MDILIKVINVLRSGYQIPDPLPWTEIAGPLAAAEDTLARLDERLARSPIREGWIARTHFTDACASLWLEGELVHMDDLVLHDAGMDVRAPTHELTRAHAVLRTRRRIGSAKPDWALSVGGLTRLRGRGGQGDLDQGGSDRKGRKDEAFEPDDVDGEADQSQPFRATPTDERLLDVFAAVDAAIAQADRTLAGETNGRRHAQPERDPLVYDLDWDEDERLAEWRAVIDQTRTLPPTLATAIAADAWSSIEPLQHAPWLGRLLASALLRERGKTRWHLPCLHYGLKALPRERRRQRDSASRLSIQVEAIALAGEAGLQDHDRWLTARTLLARKLDGRRTTSRLPALLDYVLSRPIISAGMIAKELKITPRAAQDLVAELGLREATGRGRYRAWGFFE
ncbi:RHE_PE00001 family protein (plasmid) [Bradyrhizobium betae]